MKTLLRLLTFLCPFWLWVGLSVLLGAAAVGSGIGLMGASAYIIATAALQPSIAVLQVAIVGVRFFGISRGVFRYLERLVSHSLNFRLLARLRIWFYRALEPLAPAGLLRYRSGDVLARAVVDIETLENFYLRAVAPPLVALVVILGVSALVGQASIGFSLILSTGLLLSGALLPLLVYFASRKPSTDNISARAELSAALVDGLQGTADLAAYRQVETYLQQFERLSQRAGRAQFHLILRGAWSNAANLLITNLTLWGMLVLGILFVNQGKIDGVTLSILALLTLASFEAVLPLSQAAQQLEMSVQAGKRVFELADQLPQVLEPDQPAEPPVSGSISMRGVSFRYAPNLPWVLNNIDLDLLNGDHVALSGPSGTGKTTLLYLLLRFWRIERGEIFLGGQNLQHLSGSVIHHTVSLMTQNTFLFNGTIRRNLLLAKSDADELELWQALRDAQLERWVRTLPNGLETWVGEDGQKLSAGERQRLAVARLLLQNAPVVLLDEPTSHLDAITARQIHEVLFSMTRGKTVIWITHEHTDLDHFNRILSLDNGRIMEVSHRN